MTDMIGYNLYFPAIVKNMLVYHFPNRISYSYAMYIQPVLAYRLNMAQYYTDHGTFATNENISVIKPKIDQVKENKAPVTIAPVVAKPDIIQHTIAPIAKGKFMKDLEAAHLKKLQEAITLETLPTKYIIN